MENTELTISVSLRKDYQPHFFDLSGVSQFDFYLDIKRCHLTDKSDRDLTLLANESVFDIPYAFREGLLELIDEETGAVVVWPSSGKELQKREERKFITLFRRSLMPDKTTGTIHSIPFNIFEDLKTILQPEGQYRIWLRDLDLNVKWWSFAPPTDSNPNSPLPPSESGKVVAKTTTNKLFHTVSSIRTPPPISITLTLSSSEISYSGPPPTLRVSITNLGLEAIAVKSSGGQPYVSSSNVNPRDSHITCPIDFPSLKNFLITSETGATILDIPDCPSAGPHGLSRTNFTTLQPGVSVAMEGEFLVQEWIRKKLRNEGGYFKLRLKKRNAWWSEGSVEDLYAGRKKLAWTELWRSACLPVVLESSDEIVFAFVE